MPIAIDPTETREYVLKCDREQDGKTPKAGATVFILGMLSAREQMQCQKALDRVESGSRDFVDQSYRSLYTVLHYGLRGWSNFRDRHGKEIEFVPLPVSGEWPLLGQVDQRWLAELAREITTNNQVTQDEEGNSESR